jgi:hypothetical protein
MDRRARGRCRIPLPIPLPAPKLRDNSALVGAMAPPMAGENRLGAVVYEIDAGEIEAKIIEVPGLSPHWIDDVVEEVYPRRPAN